MEDFITPSPSLGDFGNHSVHAYYLWPVVPREDLPLFGNDGAKKNLVDFHLKKLHSVVPQETPSQLGFVPFAELS